MTAEEAAMVSKTQANLQRRIGRLQLCLEQLEKGDRSTELVRTAKRELEYIKEITMRMDLDPSVPDPRNGEEEDKSEARAAGGDQPPA